MLCDWSIVVKYRSRECSRGKMTFVNKYQIDWVQKDILWREKASGLTECKQWNSFQSSRTWHLAGRSQCHFNKIFWSWYPSLTSLYRSQNMTLEPRPKIVDSSNFRLASPGFVSIYGGATSFPGAVVKERENRERGAWWLGVEPLQTIDGR